MSFHLSEKQQKTMASALTILAAVIILAAVAVLFWVIGIFLRAFSGVLLPLAVAAVAALVFKPEYQWFRGRLKAPKTVGVILVFLSFLLPLAAFAWIFGALIVDQASDLFARAPEAWASFSAAIKEKWPKIVAMLGDSNLLDRLGTAVEGQEAVLMEGLQLVSLKAVAAGAGVVRGIGSLLGWVVLPVYFAFFLLAETDSRTSLERWLPFLKTETRKDVVYLVSEFVDILVAFFRGQLIIALLQGMLFALGFTIVGLKYGFLIGLALGFLNIIPYLGSMIGLGVAIPLALFQTDGGWSRLIAVLVVFTLVQMVEGYLLTPKIMGDRTGLHPMAIIVAIFFWGTALSGILGMILAIPLTAFLVVFWRLAKEKYVLELV
ncbi:MAG: AI-2E family transporter [Thermoanaerobaculales bacterium]|nr:AI-2E family transporter [Thermoanaerobaculales bacterium]